MPNPDHDESTLPPSSLSEEIRPDGPEIPALILLWSRHEPERAGEALLVPQGAGPWIFGRGESGANERRLSLVRQRPGVTEPTGPLSCPRISREQLAVTALDDGSLAIESTGRCAMAIDEREVASGVARPGSVIELRNEVLFLVAERPLRLAPLVAASAAHPFGEPDANGILGESPAIWRLRDAIARAGARPEHVLVRGPSGAGKELVAQALHAGSARASRPIVARNAATIQEGLADAELFGNARNYPHPSMPERPGLVGQADKSTLFLDELGELPTTLQARLLRVLDRGEYQRLGEATARRSDFRLVAATNRPEDHLKHDVLARLELRIEVPGLGARREDVPLLAAHFLRRKAGGARAAAEVPRLSPRLMHALVVHRYTTHVRELEALLLAALLDGSGKYLELTEGVRRRLAGTSPERAAPAPAAVFGSEELRRLAILRRHRFRLADCGRDKEYPGNRQTADLHLRQLACKALRAADWDVAEAAALLADGGDDEVLRRLRGRIETFLSNLVERLAEPPGQASSGAARRALLEEWKGSAGLLEPVLDALSAGKIRRSADSSSSGSGPPSGD